MVTVDNSFSCSFTPERRAKFLTRKLEEINLILGLSGNEEQVQAKSEMFFHKLRGTAATFDFMSLDALSIRANGAKGKALELQKFVGECKDEIIKLLAAL